ncbi:CDP-alcohol phosphatidyltransferase family protein [bacterium]|nr:CDP-alcohol phosphatidyltransferase family protein [bacterium]
MEKTKDKERVNDILLGPLERPALLWLSERMPAWVTPDVLTVIGIMATLIITGSYYLSNFEKNFLWLANFGFILNWFGDSLDGSVARFRHIERPKYGYFVDHAVDAFSSTAICIGLGISPYVGFTYGLLALIGYLLMSIYVYLSTNVTGVFKISYGKIGPTEIRVLYMSVNAVFYFVNNFSVTIGSFTIMFFDLIALVVAIALFFYFAFFTIKTISELAIIDPPGVKKS